ncbi:MAG: choice-of-anchor L domain-containing protein [Polyangiaceae bacterium]|nr:choice-of-anchor L domain-containing protein [Polyangiaceae bacterium]
MTRSLLSTSLVLVALGTVITACDDGSTGTGGQGTTSAGGGGSGGTGGGTTSSGTAGATTGSTSSTGGSGGSTGGSGGSTGGTGGSTTSSTSSTTTSTSSGMTTSSTTPVMDADKDGWTIADGDCCDSPFANCSDKPELVNPGALEVPGNNVDDDCNPTTLDTAAFPTCSTKTQADLDIQNQAALSSLKLVKAMDLCATTLEVPPTPKDKTWGVISSKITLADGTDVVAPKNIQLGVLPDFGPNVQPQYGETMAALSTGTARKEGQPGYVHPQNGAMPGQTGNYNAQTQCSAPAEYLAANGGQLPSPCGNCMGPTCTQSFDSVALRVRIRPPTNAKSFSYRFNFFSSEYPEFLCDDYNDFFVALINGNSNDQIPADKNIAFDSNFSPISVNNAFFQVCFPAVGAPPGSCSGGTLELIGNGMGGWNGSITDGGGTGWLQNDVPMLLKPNPNNPNPPANCDPPPNPNDPQPDCIPVVETFDLQFIIWDAGDHNVDSIILLDRFRWNLQSSELSTHQ